MAKTLIRPNGNPSILPSHDAPARARCRGCGCFVQPRVGELLFSMSGACGPLLYGDCINCGRCDAVPA